MFIGENLRNFRKKQDWTQEDVAERLHVSPQSVSKWERGDALPDIGMLPALANLYRVSVDALLGMDRINEAQARAAIFEEGNSFLRAGDNHSAEAVFSRALKTFPVDEGLMLALALVLAQENEPSALQKSAGLCERVLQGNPSEKARHTTRAALCFIYYKLGESKKAQTYAQNLPHRRESREDILFELDAHPNAADVNAYLRFLTLGENQQDKICIDFHISMLPMYEAHDLLGKIRALRNEASPNKNVPNFHRLPQVRIIDNMHLPTGTVRVNYCEKFLLDAVFQDPKNAIDAVMGVLREVAMRGKD